MGQRGGSPGRGAAVLVEIKRPCLPQNKFLSQIAIYPGSQSGVQPAASPDRQGLSSF